jgi:hypothetical protein
VVQEIGRLRRRSSEPSASANDYGIVSGKVVDLRAVLADSVKRISKFRVCLRVHDKCATVAVALGNQHTFIIP